MVDGHGGRTAEEPPTNCLFSMTQKREKRGKMYHTEKSGYVKGSDVIDESGNVEEGGLNYSFHHK